MRIILNTKKNPTTKTITLQPLNYSIPYHKNNTHTPNMVKVIENHSQHQKPTPTPIPTQPTTLSIPTSTTWTLKTPCGGSKKKKNPPTHSNSVRIWHQPEKTMIIGKFCREFRTTVLKKRLIDLAPDTWGTLSAFEHGSSTNMNHLATYYRFSNTEQKTLFIEGVKNALEEMTNGN